MFGRSRREFADVAEVRAEAQVEASDLHAIDEVLGTLAGRLGSCADPFERLRIMECIDVQLDRRVTVMTRLRRGRDDAGPAVMADVSR